MMTQEAILYYADHPADFVEDLLHVTPDKNQRAILDSVAKNQMTSVRSGLGGGVTDRLRRVKREQPERFWWMDIIPVYFGQRIHHDFYYDSTTYMMSVVKNLLAPQTPEGAQKPVQLILPNDNDLVGQLSTRKYSMTDDAKIRVESKDAMKKRGMHSPDEADCILLLCLPVKPKRRGDVKK